MIEWLYLTDDERRLTLSQAQQNSGIKASAIEKDWWVTLVLKALFIGTYAQHLVFKGGTSLSKGWGLINRFSEDIDIVLDPVAFGQQYLYEPGSEALKRLKIAGCEFTSNGLLEDLINQLKALGLPDGKVNIYAEPTKAGVPDKDPQVIFVDFTSLYAPNPYLPPNVKIEVGVRSLSEPNRVRSMQSLLTQHFPSEIYPETPFEVLTVEPVKTLIEKAFLLCEEFEKPVEKGGPRVLRMSRHFSDIVGMDAKGVVEPALANRNLYDTIIHHRRHYSRYNWFDYGKLQREHIVFVPPADLLEAYKKDYDTMREEMIYGEAPTFEALIAALEVIQSKFNRIVVTEEILTPPAEADGDQMPEKA